jgi:CRP/FNR family transcriptional regulator
MATPVLLPDNLFSGLPAELSRELFAKARILPLKADQMVFLAGDAGDGCYRIEEGLLKVSVGGSEGDERILATTAPAPIGLPRAEAPGSPASRAS